VCWVLTVEIVNIFLIEIHQNTYYRFLAFYACKLYLCRSWISESCIATFSFNNRLHTERLASLYCSTSFLTSCHRSGFFQGILRTRFRSLRISNWVLRIRENYHRVPIIKENQVLRIRQIRSLQIHTGYLTFSLKKTCIGVNKVNKQMVWVLSFQ